MVPAPTDLTPTQHQVIAALSGGATVTAAAEQAGVHRTTIHHWRRTQPAFAAALADAQADVAEHWRGQLVAQADQALAVLKRMLTDKYINDGLRVRVALAILQYATTPPTAAPAANALPKLKHLAAAPAPAPECVPADAIQHHSSLSSTEAAVAAEEAPALAPVATPPAPSPLAKPSPNATRPTRAQQRAGFKERLDAALAQHRLKQGASRSGLLPECP